MEPMIPVGSASLPPGPALPTPLAPVVAMPGTAAGRSGHRARPFEGAGTPPPAAPAPAARQPRNARRATRAPAARPRSASPLPAGSAGPAIADAAPVTDGDEELGIKDVLGMVKRSFATVRGALTEQRARASDLERQVAAGMTKIDRLAVALEQSMSAHATDRQMLANMSQLLDNIMERMKADADNDDAAPVEADPHAWVAPVRKDLLRVLKDDFIHAKSAWAVYKPMEEHHATLVRLVAERLGVTPEEASVKLLTRIPSSKRKNSKSPATVVAYRYLKRAVSHFYENLGKAAVKAFISSVNESTGMGKQVPVKGSRTRTVLALDQGEAIHLRQGDRFIHEAYAHKALLAGASNMFGFITAGHLFQESAPGNADRTVVCLLAHMAFVVTKVREHLRLRANDGTVVPLTDAAGMNEGHREPWIRELSTLDGVYWRLPAASNGLRLVDAASPTRASPLPPPDVADAAAGTVPTSGAAVAGGAVRASRAGEAAAGGAASAAVAVAAAAAAAAAVVREGERSASTAMPGGVYEGTD